MKPRPAQPAPSSAGAGVTSGVSANAALAALGRRRTYRKGTIVIEEGDTSDSVFIIVSGRVKVFSTDADGHEITYGVHGTGDYFGEMSLDGGPRSASVITMEPTECAVLNRAEIRKYMMEDPDFAFELLVTAIGRAREATRIARGLALGGAYSRLRAFLDQAAVVQPDGTRVIGEPITQSEIASRIGCGREMVSRLLTDLKTGGYIGKRDRLIVIHGKLPEKW